MKDKPIGVAVDRDELQFPVLCISRDTVDVFDTYDELCTCTAYALKRGYYKNMQIIDSAGICRTVSNATKIRGVGWCFGYNVFLDQTILVKLTFASPVATAAIDEVRSKVQRHLRRDHGWSSRGDFPALGSAVRSASSIRELIELLRDPRP